MTTPHLAIRADGGRAIGVGHLARCLALTQAWNDRGGRTTLISLKPPRHWVDRFRAEGADWTPPRPGWEATGDWMVLDGYHLGDAQATVRKAGTRLTVIDDHGRTGTADADVLVDQNLGASRSDYPIRLATTDLLFGTRYVMLRREFRSRQEERWPAPAQARRLLVSLGGAPSEDDVDILHALLDRPELHSFDVTHLDGSVVDVAATMAESDIALSTSGSTCWELCSMGVPSVLVQTADNQLPVARATSAAGAAVDAGPLGSRPLAEVAALVADLAGDPRRRDAMAEVARLFVDGRGAARVAARLQSALLHLRPASESDAELLWEWANDDAVRASAFSSAPISWETHVGWLRSRLADPHTRLFVASLPDNGPIGQVRFEGSAEAEISVSLAAEHRGRGWGGALVIAGVRRMFEDPGVSTVVARVKPENLASARTFEEAAFDYAGERSDAHRSWLHYTRRRDD